MELKRFFKSLSLIHVFLVAGLIVFTVFALLQDKGFHANTNDQNMMLYSIPIAALIGYFGSQLVFKKMTDKITRTEVLEEKLKKYQSALISKFALIEGPAFLGLFAYTNSGNALPLVIALCLLVYLIVQKPNKNTIFKSVPLTQEEIETIERT